MEGSSHPEVFCKISAPEIFNFTRIIQCFVLRSKEFVCESFFWGGGGDDRTMVWIVGLRGSLYMFSLDFRNILFSEELSWLFLLLLLLFLFLFLFFFGGGGRGEGAGFFCDTLLVWCWPALIPNYSLSLCLVTLEN